MPIAISGSRRPADTIARRTAVLVAVLLAALSLTTPATVDAGTVALPAPLAGQSLLLDAATAGPRLVAVGERGHILLSDDDGARWRQVPSPTRSTLTAVFFADAQRGWAVGHDAVILRSRDAGDSWQQVHAAVDLQSPLLDLYFSDPRHGIAVGAYGLALRTRDGGHSWQRESLNDSDDFHLNAITADATGGLIIAAEAGMAYRQAAAGTRWTTLPSPYSGSFFGLLSPAADELWLFGLRGNLYRSLDAGGSWQRADSGSEAALTDAARLADGRLVIVGHAGTVLWSSADGKRFEQFELPGRPALSAVIETPSGRLLGFGERGAHLIELPGTTR